MSTEKSMQEVSPNDLSGRRKGESDASEAPTHSKGIPHKQDQWALQLNKL